MNVSEKLTAYKIRVVQKQFLYICKNLHEVKYQKTAVCRNG